MKLNKVVSKWLVFHLMHAVHLQIVYMIKQVRVVQFSHQIKIVIPQVQQKLNVQNQIIIHVNGLEDNAYRLLSLENYVHLIEMLVSQFVHLQKLNYVNIKMETVFQLMYNLLIVLILIIVMLVNTALVNVTFLIINVKILQINK